MAPLYCLILEANTFGEVRDWLHTAGLYFKPDGTGKAISQEQLPGTVVSPGTPIVVQFSH